MPPKKLTTEQVLKKFKECHGDRYNYDKMIYIRSDEKIIVTCPIHGEFKIRPNHHWRGIGCKKCGIISKIKKTTTNKLTIIDEIISLLGNEKYDFSETKYIHSEEKLSIICREHGKFEMLLSNIRAGYGCPECLRISKLPQRKLNFIEQSKQIHNNKYDYSLVDYINSETLVKIICIEHGEFEQLPGNHLKGKGCPKCVGRISKPELELHKLFEGIAIQTNKRDVINQELDIYIPSKKLAIEYNGLYWHNEVNKPDSKYHLKKTEACEKQGIQLIHIFEDEWIEKPEIVKSRINNLLGINKFRVYARNCYIKEVDTIDSRKFLVENHMQGFVGSKVSYGLYFKIPNTENNVLVSLMTFGSLRKNLGSTSSDDTEYELLRFCNKLNTSVVGAASKLFKHFLKLHNPSKIISYADRRWSLGKLYEQLGFEFSHNSSPNYFYVIGQKGKIDSISGKIY